MFEYPGWRMKKKKEKNTWKCLNNKEKESSNDAPQCIFIHVILIIEAALGSPHRCLSYNVYFSLKIKLATTYVGSQSKFVLICLFPFFITINILNS